jgi:hypothetical protein
MSPKAADKDDAGDRLTQSRKAAYQCNSIHDGHAYIGHQQIDGVILEDGERVFSVFSFTYLATAGTFEPHLEDLEEIRFIIH